MMNYYTADVISYSDYYPFGMLMPNRHGADVSPSDMYKYGYQGSEKDGEVHGESYTTHFRQLDTRIGRWLSIDPKMAKFPWQSPYVSMDNKPVWRNDPKGDEINPLDKKSGKRMKRTIKKSFKGSINCKFISFLKIFNYVSSYMRKNTI